MNKIINGKIYNTEAATLLCKFNIKNLINNNCELYQNNNAEYFLINKIMETVSPLFNHLMLISEEMAKKYVETYCTTNQYNKIFGRVAK